MNDIDSLLQEAGEQWRASQRHPPEIDPAALVANGRRSSPALLLVAGATGAALVILIGVAAMQLSSPGGVGGPAPGAPTLLPSPANASPDGGQACDVTRPNPPFVPPTPYLESPPPNYGSDWFGTAGLWTMLDRDGEVWKQSSLPHVPAGLTQKTFWWSADWLPDANPEPPITVVGTRLDVPGSFSFGPGTNASADFGTAMLVGIDVPTPGCWQLTGRYRDASLSYVVWITDDASAEPVTQAPNGSDGTTTSSPDVASSIDPDWVTRPTLTCGDPDRVFPPEALDGAGLAELGLDPAAAVLRSVLANTPPETPFPEHGWHRVIDDPSGVTFVAASVDPTPWWEVSVGLLAGTLQATGYGQCQLAIASPAGVSFGRWWLDPNLPAVSPDATELSIYIRERVCASGKSPEGRILPPTIVMGTDAIEVAIGIRERPGGQDCQGNPAHQMRLVLPEPVDSRMLFDASQYPPRPVTTEDPG